jgi:hypothetical protein
MTVPANRSLLGLGRLLATCWIVAAPAGASAAPRPDPAGVFRYQLTAMGTLGGEAVLTVDGSSALGDGTARRVRLEARTAGVAGRVYKAKGDGTTVMDRGFNPLRMKWSSETRGYPRDATLVFHAKGVQGTYRGNQEYVSRVDVTTETWPLDAISAYLWLPQQPLASGATYQRPFFDGRRIGTLEATVGLPRSIQVPVGLRDVVPMHITAGRPGKEKTIVFWVGVLDRVLYRIEVSHGILGTVRADLIGLKRPEIPLGRGQEARE